MDRAMVIRIAAYGALTALAAGCVLAATPLFSRSGGLAGASALHPGWDDRAGAGGGATGPARSSPAPRG